MTNFRKTYQVAVGRNISGARGQRQISQSEVARRMQLLGFDEWQHPTVSLVERGRRRLMCEEAIGLALVLKTTVPRLMSPLDDIAAEWQHMDVSAESIAAIVNGTSAGDWPFDHD